MRSAMSQGVIKTALAIALMAFAACGAARAATSQRVKDIAKIEGVRENQLVGFGLVTGLNGTGDGVDLTKSAVQNMMERFDIKVDLGAINVDNIAAVMVTAQMPAFVKPGDTVDVTVSSIGDAESLRGGMLLQTAMRGADGKVYAVAQGPVSIGGYSEGTGGGARASKGFPTSGRIPGGGIVERLIPTEIMTNNTLFINLNQPDFTNAARLQKVIDKKCATAEWRSLWGNCSATALDASSVKVVAPGVGDDTLVTFIAYMETLNVDIDHVAKVVINEKTGTIVMGADVRIDPVQIAHGSLSVKVDPGFNVSQPLPFSGGETVVMPDDALDVEEPTVTFHKVSVGDIVKALNDMGVTPSDIIAILQAAKVEGALQAQIVTM